MLKQVTEVNFRDAETSSAPFDQACILGFFDKPKYKKEKK